MKSKYSDFANKSEMKFCLIVVVVIIIIIITGGGGGGSSSMIMIMKVLISLQIVYHGK
jgi:hypothetical protein